MFNIKTGLLALVISASCIAGDSESAATKARAAGHRPVSKVAGSRRGAPHKRRQEPIPAEYQKLAFAEEKPDTFVAQHHTGAGRGKTRGKTTGLKQPKRGF